MTNQEAFTRIVQHLRQQNGKSRNERGVCQYRDDAHRRRCAVGVLITDEFYTPAMEGIAIGTPGMYVFSQFFESIAPVSIVLLKEMQEVHDRITVSEWEIGFTKIAKLLHLTVPLRDERPANQPESLAQVEEALSVEHTMEVLCTTKA